MDVSRNHLASLFGCSPRLINELEERGLVIKSSLDTYDRDKSILTYITHLREIASGRGGEGPTKNLTEERAKLASIQTLEKKLKVAKARGELVEAEGVAREWIAVLQKVRAGILAVPARVQQRLMHLTAVDVSEIDLEIRAVLTELGTDEQTAQ